VTRNRRSADFTEGAGEPLFVTFLSPLFVTLHAITLDEQREEIRGSKMWIGLVFCSMSHVR
jgi:hypothetical protein